MDTGKSKEAPEGKIRDVSRPPVHHAPVDDVKAPGTLLGCAIAERQTPMRVRCCSAGSQQTAPTANSLPA